MKILKKLYIWEIFRLYNNPLSIFKNHHRRPSPFKEKKLIEIISISSIRGAGGGCESEGEQRIASKFLNCVDQDGSTVAAEYKEWFHERQAVVTC